MKLLSTFSLLTFAAQSLESCAFHAGRSAFNIPSTLSFARSILSHPLNFRDRDEDSDDFAVNMPNMRQSLKPGLLGNTGVSMPILKSLAMSQSTALFGGTILTALTMAATGQPIDLNCLHWNGNDHFFSPWDFTITPVRVIEGILAATPMIFLGHAIERAESRECSQVNFSTMNIVMTLFGRREHTHGTDIDEHPILHAETPMFHVLFLAAGLAVLTGLSEEYIFRCTIPAAIFHQTSSVLIALFGQATLFGLGHVSPQAKPGENNIVAGLQVTTGVWHGLVYLMTGGDLLPCIIAHFVYDWHVFMETWMTTNSQMDYTNKAALTKLSQMEERELRKIKEEAGPSLTSQTLALARRFFYAFDYKHCSSLSKADVQRAITYAFLHDAKQPTEDRVSDLFDRILESREKDSDLVSTNKDEHRLVLPEFLRVLFLLKASSQAV